MNIFGWILLLGSIIAPRGIPFVGCAIAIISVQITVITVREGLRG
jgi:hypothetical protein